MSEKYISPFPRLVSIWRNTAENIPTTPRVLDFGCGNGAEVKYLLDKGLDAFGCDIKFKEGDFVEHLHNMNRIRIIDAQNYVLPFPDDYFDLVISNQVLEHVQNYDETASELRRVLKPNGLGIHLFPPKLKPIEAHVYVPFSSIIRNRLWMIFWIWLGFRKADDKRRNVADVADEKISYLNSSTNYQSGTWILSKFRGSGFSSAYWGNRTWLKCSSSKKGKLLFLMTRAIPILLYFHITFVRKILITVK